MILHRFSIDLREGTDREDYQALFEADVLREKIRILELLDLPSFPGQRIYIFLTDNPLDTDSLRAQDTDERTTECQYEFNVVTPPATQLFRNALTEPKNGEIPT